MATDAQALLLQVSADTSKAVKRLDDLQKKLNGTAKAAERSFDKANDNIARTFGKGLGAAVGQEVDALAGQASRASTVLSGFGLAGVAAAAGIGALSVALSGAREAARFADEIADTADRLHVTTDALQEYRYAIRAAGGEEKGADEALEKFSVTLGKAQQGLERSQKAFRALGFTEEQIAGFQSAEEALEQVVERISGLSDVQQDAIIQQLGLEGIKPLIDDGVESMKRLRDEARKVGVVMDADLIKRGAELNQQFETVQQVIDIQLKSALVDLGPILLGLIKLVASLASAARDVVDAFRSIQNKTVQGLQSQRDERLRQAESPLARAVPALRRRALAEAATFDREIKRREAEAKAPPPPRPSRNLIDTSAGGGARGGSSRARSAPREARDTTFERTQQVDAALLDAERDLLQAWSQLVVGADQRAEISKSILDVEQQLLNARLDKQVADINADEGLSAAKKAELVASLEIVRAEQGKVDALRREVIDREVAQQKAREGLELRQEEVDAQAELVQLELSLARTAADRRDLSLKLLDLADQRVKLEQEAVLASKESTEVEKELARRRLRLLEQTRGTREEATRRDTAGPLERFVNDNRGSEVLLERQTQTLVNGLGDLSTALADAAINGGNFLDSLRNIVNELATETLADTIQTVLANGLSSLGLGTAPADAAGAAGAAAAGPAIGAAITTAGTTAGAAMGSAITTGGTTSATQFTTSISTAGTSAATAMGTAITAAGAQAAAAMAAAISTANASSNLTSLGSSFSFSGGTGGGDLFAGLYAEGGRVRGPGTGKSDSIPAYLSNGEFVINAEAAKKNLTLLTAINDGRMPKYAAGGEVASPSPVAVTPPTFTPPVFTAPTFEAPRFAPDRSSRDLSPATSFALEPRAPAPLPAVAKPPPVFPLLPTGPIRGPGTGKSDSILAKVSNGEFLVNARDTRKHRDLLETINRGALPRFAEGGFVGPKVSIPNNLMQGLARGGPVQSEPTSGGVHIGGIYVTPTGHMSATDNRRTASQIAAGLRREIAGTAKAGF
jgi:hypothetical protein